MYQRKRLTALIILAVMTGVAYAATIKDVVVRQRWPWSRKVDIEYILECEAGYEYDITLKAYNGAVPLDLPVASLSGDIFGVRDGARRIVWDPTLTEYKDDGVINNFKVELSLERMPLYMIIDLTKNPGEDGQIEYVYEPDNVDNEEGTWVRNPVTNLGDAVESVVWTAITNNNIYRTEKLVMRRIRAGTFMMGDEAGAPLETTLTRDFYMGVFQVTQWQWLHIYGSWSRVNFTNEATRAYRPMEGCSYNNIRGSVAEGSDWPTTGYAVTDDSFMDKLRKKTGVEGFDLPTEAQWEYACRAGTTTYYNDGLGRLGGAQLAVLCRYRYNGGYVYVDGDYEFPERNCGPEHGTAIVGSYLPNAWGLYDMLGNVEEWCLDYSGAAIEGGVDPVGLYGGTKRRHRGGCFYSGEAESRVWQRRDALPAGFSNAIGCRVVMVIP